MPVCAQLFIQVTGSGSLSGAVHRRKADGNATGRCGLSLCQAGEGFVRFGLIEGHLQLFGLAQGAPQSQQRQGELAVV